VAASFSAWSAQGKAGSPTPARPSKTAAPSAQMKKPGRARASQTQRNLTVIP